MPKKTGELGPLEMEQITKESDAAVLDGLTVVEGLIEARRMYMSKERREEEVDREVAAEEREALGPVDPEWFRVIELWGGYHVGHNEKLRAVLGDDAAEFVRFDERIANCPEELNEDDFTRIEEICRRYFKY